MPKKTKKAKLIAEYRRKLQQLEGTPIQPTIHTTVDPVPSTASEYILPKNIGLADKMSMNTQNDSIVSLEFSFNFGIIKTLALKEAGNVHN